LKELDIHDYFRIALKHLTKEKGYNGAYLTKKTKTAASAIYGAFQENKNTTYEIEERLARVFDTSHLAMINLGEQLHINNEVEGIELCEK